MGTNEQEGDLDVIEDLKLMKLLNPFSQVGTNKQKGDLDVKDDFRFM